jgi:hypothetical protein
MAADERSVSTVKVLVFAPPKICLHQPEKKARMETQGKRLYSFLNINKILS